MRDPKRIDSMIEHLRRVWKDHPDLRLGQLILNCRDDDNTWSRLYNMEESELHKRLDEIYGRQASQVQEESQVRPSEVGRDNQKG